ncbi:MAG: hypothetical protein LBB45_02955 [Methanobrevibacter sp.]|nr:hypothetical protein [Candidatus Methanovirga basalitermitum]
MKISPPNGIRDRKPIISHKYLCKSRSRIFWICHPDKNVRKKRYNLFKDNGVVIEDEVGNRMQVSPDEAEQILTEMSEDKKKLYIE